MVKKSRQYLFYLLFILVSAPLLCIAQGKRDRETPQLKWDSLSQLPDISGHNNIGVSGAYSGISQNALLVAGGANFPDAAPWKGGAKKYYNDVYVLPFNEGKPSSWLDTLFHLPFQMGYGASLTVNNGILCIGGKNNDRYLSSVFLLQWDQANHDINTVNLPSLPQPLAMVMAAHIGNIVYVAGGEDTSGTKHAFYRLDLDHPDVGWEKLPAWPGPSLAEGVMIAQANGDHQCLYLIGGRTSVPGKVSQFHNSVYEYDPTTGRWEKRNGISGADHQPAKLASGTGIDMGSSYILLFGGNDGKLYNEIEQCTIALNKTKDNAQKTYWKQRQDSIFIHHPGFSREIYLYNTVTDIWTTLGKLPYPAQVNTVAFHYGNDIIIPAGEVHPGVRTSRIVSASINPVSHFSILDYVVLGIYFLLMIGIGVWTSRRQKSTDDYFKANEKIPGWAAGLSIFGSQLSAITFMAIPAKAYGTNWNYFILLMTIILIYPFIARYFIPFFRNLKVTTAYEYLEKRFNYAVRFLGSLLFILLQVGRIAIVLLLPSLALTIVTGIPVHICILLMGGITILYTVKGGIEAVIWTDVAQVVILMGGALFCLILIPIQLHSSPQAAWESLQHYQKLQLADFHFDLTKPTLWVILVGGIAINIVSYGSDQTVVQRYLTTKDIKTAKKSLRLGAWMVLPSAIIFFGIGSWLFLFYRDFPQAVNIRLNSQDAIFPWYIVSELPAGLIGLLIAAVFAAAMSTLSSSLNSVSTAAIADFYRRWNNKHGDKHYLHVAQSITAIVGLIGTALALWMAGQGISSLWDQFNLILGLFTGSLGGVFLLGIFTKRANGWGAFCGLIVSAILQYILHFYTPMHLLLFGFTGAVSCIIFGYLFSLFIPGKLQLKNLTIYSIEKKPV